MPPAGTHQCQGCFRKKTATKPGGLCGTCLKNKTQASLRSSGQPETDVWGLLGSLVGGLGVVLALSAGGLPAGSLAISVPLLVFGIIGWVRFSHAESAARAKVLERAASDYQAEVHRIEGLICSTTLEYGSPSVAGEFFVYVHYCPVSQRVVYVGKGKGERDHVLQRTSHEHSERLRSGSLHVHRLLGGVNEQTALEQESYLIGLFGRKQYGGTLYNVQSGHSISKNHLPSLSACSGTSSKSSIPDFGHSWRDFFESTPKSLWASLSEASISEVILELGWSHHSEIDPLQLVNSLRDADSLGSMVQYWSFFSSFCDSLCAEGRLEANPFSNTQGLGME